MLTATGRTLIDPEALLDKLHVQGKCFLDLCCGGHGHYVMPAARRAGADGHVIAVDLSSKSLDALESRLRDAGVTNVEVVHGDVERPGGVPLADGVGEVILLANAMPWFTSPLTAAQEMQRLLRSGGVLAVVGAKKSSPFYGLAKMRQMSEDTVRLFLEEQGLVQERDFEAGPHHFCLMFRKLKS